MTASPPPFPITIRPATADDLPAMEWDGALTYYRRVYQRTLSEMQRGQKLILVALTQGRLAGQIFIQLHSSEPEFADGTTRGYLYSLRVRPEWQGRGIGSQLLAAAEHELAQRGYRIAVISARKDNLGAQRLYERSGYRTFMEDPGEWSFNDDAGLLRQLVEPCWVMEKTLKRET